ncbi:MAG: UbiD family decarboxylase, partial [Betaproteobacteria bacterium]|nr:UbiD family decarboxylase [Betaproteobacteria bacterium]
KRAMLGLASFIAAGAKMVVAVNDDIDPMDLNAVFWAMGMRCRPDRDITVIPGFHNDMVPPYDELDENGMAHGHHGEEEAVLLIDATMKQPFPPVSLPKREYMERALEIWQKLGLPELNLKRPWYGYELGQWSEKLERAANAAVKGDYRTYGEELASRRVPAPKDF